RRQSVNHIAIDCNSSQPRTMVCGVIDSPRVIDCMHVLLVQNSMHICSAQPLHVLKFSMVSANVFLVQQ
ncbi:hypothetical protein, partial [Klebsiella pneumoniae]|uniref:hypothetical protein n=1 Tax=Klebsiella pneumoniae TaxID=573 RepID=UPI001F2CA439